MSEAKKIKIAGGALVLSFSIEIIRWFLNISPPVDNTLSGILLLLLLVAIGTAAKIAGSISSSSSFKKQARTIMVLGGLLGAYTFII